MNLAALELWALRGLAIAGLMVGVYIKGCTDGVHKDDLKHKADAAIALMEEQKRSAKNQLESANRQSDVLVAEAAVRQAQADLAAYRRAHSLRGVLANCVRQPTASGDSADACRGAGNGDAIAACQAARLLQQNGAVDPGDRLDALLGEADDINNAYRICLATRRKGP